MNKKIQIKNSELDISNFDTNFVYLETTQTIPSMKSTHDIDNEEESTPRTDPEIDLLVIRHFMYRVELNQLRCPHCDIIFEKHIEFRKHMHRDHGDRKPYECHLCDKCYMKRTVLMQHYDREHFPNSKSPRSRFKMPFRCRICRTPYRLLWRLENHIRDKHGTESNPFQCGTCHTAVAFDESPKLEEHCQRMHGIQTSFTEPITERLKCRFCEKSYIKKCSLNRHVEQMHNGARPFKCKFCLKPFIDRQKFEKHVEERHQGIKPFQCRLCDERFVSAPRMLRHRRVMHEKSERDEMDRISDDWDGQEEEVVQNANSESRKDLEKSGGGATKTKQDESGSSEFNAQTNSDSGSDSEDGEKENVFRDDLQPRRQTRAVRKMIKSIFSFKGA